ncbi:hypothetical protein ACOMHN_022756 [Nucella lapillus]
MSLNWDQVQTEFAGDETTNFGPRMETGTALYQVDTVATISTQNQTAGKVTNLVSAALGELVCVGVDCHLSIFKDSQHITTVAFENLVEDCAWSPDGSLLLVVDCGGKLHLFNASSLQSVFSCTLVQKRKPGERVFHRIAFRGDEETEGCDLVLLSATGLLFVVKGFDSSAFTQGNANLAAVVQEQLLFRKVETEEVHHHITWDALPLGGGDVITVGGGGSVIAVWKWYNCIAFGDCVSDVFESECDVISAKLTSNNKFLYTLDEMKRVGVWLVQELVMVQYVTVPTVTSEIGIQDFLLLETQGTHTSSTEGTCLVFLLRDMLSSTLQIRDMGSAQDVYSLQLDPHTCLARDYTQVSTVRLRCLTETYPETRLQRLLHKQRFEEALHFARLFHLDTELVYTAQMNQLLEQLSPWNVLCYEDDGVSAMLEQLWTSVRNIKDCLLVAENCMRAALPAFADTWKLLQLCHTKMQSAATSETERHQALITKVLDLQNRLTTYKLVYGAHSYSGNSWVQFQSANLLHLVCRDMAQHQPHMAILLWRRHSEEWRDQLSVEMVQELLQMVAERLPVASVTGWLNDDLLPYLATVLPKAMSGWPQNAISFLETLSRSVTAITEVNFTASADTAVETTTKTEVDVHSVLSPLRSTLTMLHQLRDLLKYNLRLSAKQFQQESLESVAYRMLDQVVMVELMQPTLEKYITPYIRNHRLDQDNIFATYIKKYITPYIRNHRLDQDNIFATYIKKYITPYIRNHRLDQDNIFATYIKKYITPYIRNHRLDQDNIFATYIKDLLERLGHVRLYTGQSAWEDKVLAIVSFINNPKEKCCAVLNVIKHAPLPWSAEIQQLVEEGLKVQHPLVGELREAKKIADMRLLMQGYGLKGTVPNRSQAERLAVHIVKQDQASSLADAQRVLKEYGISDSKSLSEVYITYANKLIRTNKVAEYLRILHTMDTAQARRLGERVVSLAEICLDRLHLQRNVRKELDEDHKLLMLAAVLTLQHLRHKTTDVAELDELNNKLNTFSSLLALQREYNMMLLVKEFSDEVNRSTVFARFTEQYLQEKRPFQGSGNLTELYRLADLLQLQREAVQGELAVVEARADNWNAVLFLCRELLKAEASPQVGRALYQVVIALLQLQGQSDPDDDNYGDGDLSANQELRRHMPVILEKLADRAVVMCDPDMLASCLDLSKSARLWRHVASQCEAAETASFLQEAVDTKVSSQEPIQTYSLDTVYTDEAVVMTSSVALPLAVTSLAATLTFMKGDEDDSDKEESQDASVRSALGPLQGIIHHLRENSHLQLALRFLVVTTSFLRQMLLNHDMGFPQAPPVKAWLDGQKTVMQDAEKSRLQLFRGLMFAFTLKVLSSHHVDHKMALACLLSTPRKVSVDCLMKSITSCNFNFRKLKVIADVGLALGHLFREVKLISICQECQTNAAWGVCLGKLKISFKEAFQGGVSAKHGVLEAMAGCEQVDVRMLTDFSLDFSMEVEDSLLVYLGELLKTSPQPWQLSKARAVVVAVEALDRKDLLLNRLKMLYKQTSPYDYEVIEFLLGEINRLDSTPISEKGLKLVSYLKMYIRRNPPSDTELSSISGRHLHKEECGDVGDMLPPGSALRVPLHPLLGGEPWKVITPELDAQSVPQWLQIVQLLELAVDEVYLIAVQNTVRRHVSHTTCASPNPLAGGGIVRQKTKVLSLRSWQVKEASLQVLEQVQLLLNCVRGCEMALACANWVVRELPMGGDKVLALQGCIEFVRTWHKKCEDNTPQKEKAGMALVKYQKVLRKVLTEQTLYINDLVEPELLKLVASPDELITCLMEHAAVVAESGQTGRLPDIFGTLQKVCKVNNLDLGQVLVTAMTTWLFASDASQDLEMTMNLSFSNLKMTEEAVDCGQSNNIKRVLYFLHRGPRSQMLKFLIDTVQTGKAESTSHLGRMNCMYCLLQIATDADLQPLGLTCHGVREMLRICCYLSQLEELHIQHSLQSLSNCSKTGLVKSIWRSYRHQKSAVQLTAALCVDYSLYDRHQWAALLQQMVTMHMLWELEHVLQRLQTVPMLWSLPVFATAWQAVLVNPLSKASLPLADDQIKSCLHTFNLLQRCPVVSQVDIQTLTHHYQQLELDVCAVACVMMDPQQTHRHTQEVVSQDPVKLIEQTYALTALGLNLPSATQVREVVFQHVLEQGDYHLIPPQALHDFFHFIVMENDIDGCLQFALSNGMEPQAEMLMELYLEHYPEVYDEVVADCENSGFTMDSAVKVNNKK